MTDLDALSPRQMCAGLMRGNMTTLQRGYSALAAAGAVRDFKHLTDTEFEALREYAYGFAAGTRDAITRDDPDRDLPQPSGGQTVLNVTHRERAARGEYNPPDAFADGYQDGLAEHGRALNPTL